MLVDCARDDNGTRLGQPFQPRRDVHPIPVNIVILHDHVAEIYADAKLHTAFLGCTAVPLSHPLLERDCAFDGIHHAGELGE